MISRVERTRFANWWWTVDRLMLAASSPVLVPSCTMLATFCPSQSVTGCAAAAEAERARMEMVAAKAFIDLILSRWLALERAWQARQTWM